MLQVYLEARQMDLEMLSPGLYSFLVVHKPWHDVAFTIICLGSSKPGDDGKPFLMLK